MKKYCDNCIYFDDGGFDCTHIECFGEIEYVNSDGKWTTEKHQIRDKNDLNKNNDCPYYEDEIIDVI